MGMNEPTPRQKRSVAAEVANLCMPISFDEASHMIRCLRREQTLFPALINKIVEADRAGDTVRLSRLLVQAKRRIAHGAWLPLLKRLSIHPRRAQRLIGKGKDR